MRPNPAKLAAIAAFVFILAGCGGGTSQGESEVGAETRQTMQTTQATTVAGSNGCTEPNFADDTPDGLSTEALPVEPLTIDAASGPVELTVEVADDSREMAQGLMFRESLGEDCGMLFVYRSERELSFWMRDTLIPLSIAYIDSEGEIIDLQDMEALDDEPPSYTSAEPAQYALEVNVGFFEENGVEVGDTVELPGL